LGKSKDAWYNVSREREERGRGREGEGVLLAVGFTLRARWVRIKKDSGGERG